MTWLSDDAVARLREAAETPDLTGTRYTMVGEVGRGAMGTVYEVRDGELDRHVAMKVAASDLSADLAARVTREARIVAALEHPGIAPIHDLGTLPDGRFYYTMKLVRGERLDAWLRKGHARSEKLRLFIRICEPVAFAHAQGVVHRDLKPENVMTGQFGAVLVMDWGVASRSSEEEMLIVGTPGYMAPEQQLGASVDSRADVFALGTLLSQMLAREELTRPLHAVIRRATAANREERYPDAGALAAEVERFLDGQAVEAHRENLGERGVRWLSKNRVLVTLIAAYIVMRVVVYVWIRL